MAALEVTEAYRIPDQLLLGAVGGLLMGSAVSIIVALLPALAACSANCGGGRNWLTGVVCYRRG